jgi:hypothetical protein
MILKGILIFSTICKGRVAGVDVVGQEVRIRGASRNPLLLVDGIDTDWTDMINIPMGDIDKIEILKSGYGMAVYGSRGGDGIIAVLTKMGKGEWENNWVRTVHGRITPTVTGYQLPREFYSPKYYSRKHRRCPTRQPPYFVVEPESCLLKMVQQTSNFLLPTTSPATIFLLKESVKQVRFVWEPVYLRFLFRGDDYD